MENLDKENLVEKIKDLELKVKEIDLKIEANEPSKFRCV